MKSIKRRVYDAYATVATLFGGPPVQASAPWADSGVELIPLSTPGSLRLEHRLEAAFYDLPESTSTISWPEISLYHIQKARVVGDQGNVFLRDGKWLRVCPSLNVLEPRKVRRPLPFYSRSIHGPAFHLTGRDHENHGHFLFQHLPRILACRDLPQVPKKIKLLVAEGHKRWQARYIQKLALAENTDIIECNEGTIRCDELFYVPQIRDETAQLCRPQDYVAMRECFYQPGPKTGLPVFISRTDAPDRRLINEAEVIASFEKVFGSCQVIQLSKVPLDEQISIISRAPLVVGSQGQAFAVSLFSKDSVFVILEAGIHNFWCDHFRDIAIICGNQAMTLYSGTARQEDHSYSFPVEKLQPAWLRLKAMMDSAY